MKHLLDLFPVVADKVVPPVLVALGSPWPVTQLVTAMNGKETVCFQMDVFAADRLRAKLAENNVAAEVVAAADLWDLPARFRTVLFPAAAHSDRDLKIDVVEQGFHVLEEGGLFITLSEYEKDVEFAKWHKKVFGKCGESPRSKAGMAFWSARHGERPRRRHEVTFHAKVGDGPSMSFASWPGTFSYGRMDNGSRAMLEVAEINPGDHVLDMGCGNGAVGCLASAKAGPTGKVTFVDSNVRAVALTDKNAKANGVPNYELVTTATLGGLPPDRFDLALANPPYYANSEVARMFIASARDLLKSGGRFYLVTKMPVQTIPEVVETFGDAESVENRGYTVLAAKLGHSCSPPTTWSGCSA
jgi:16S rRNA (guanine1207-N2)-methyltransferase